MESNPEVRALATYVLGEAEILDPDVIDRYSPVVAASVVKYGGRYLARGAKAAVFEGAAAHQMLLIEFKDSASAERWLNSPEYAQAKAMRRGASNVRLMVFDGVVQS